MMEKNAKIYVAGHRGMVGSAIVRELKRQGYTNIVTCTHKELDLCRQDAVEAFFEEEKPEYVPDRCGSENRRESEKAAGWERGCRTRDLSPAWRQREPGREKAAEREGWQEGETPEAIFS